MKNPAPYIRTQLFTLLNGTVPYENSFVPVGEGELDAKPYKILIEEMDSYKRETKSSISYTYDIGIEVIYEGPDNVRTHIDAISEIVMEKVRPGLYTSGLQDSALWQFTGVNISTPKYLTDNSASGDYIKRARMTINFLITQRVYA